MHTGFRVGAIGAQDAGPPSTNRDNGACHGGAGAVPPSTNRDNGACHGGAGAVPPSSNRANGEKWPLRDVTGSRSEPSCVIAGPCGSLRVTDSMAADDTSR